ASVGASLCDARQKRGSGASRRIHRVSLRGQRDRRHDQRSAGDDLPGTRAMSARTTPANGIAGRHVLWGLIGFFGVIFAVNAIFVYAAEETFSGGDTSDPYRKGLDYNATLRAAERQTERVWQTEIAYYAKTGRLALNFVDKSALPITGLGINATLSRPATDKEDR